jgi:hypothetical protein
MSAPHTPQPPRLTLCLIAEARDREPSDPETRSTA